jgi:hypothetical protein
MRPATKNPAKRAEPSIQAIQAGVFETLPAADRAVARLLDAGFTPEQITVVCSDETKERYFREFEHQQPAGAHADTGAVAGGGIGAAVGGLIAIAVGAASGAVPLILAGAAGVAAGSGAGVFVGAMTTRGEEKEVSNFYDQAVRGGEILVSVEVHGPHADSQLLQAARIIAEAGAKSIPLPEG